tara:strand:- start:137 stop:544 length:408 start_codon:yes stop_codon:yes gene_type:complete
MFPFFFLAAHSYSGYLLSHLSSFTKAILSTFPVYFASPSHATFDDLIKKLPNACPLLRLTLEIHLVCFLFFSSAFDLQLCLSLACYGVHATWKAMLCRNPHRQLACMHLPHHSSSSVSGQLFVIAQSINSFLKTF